MIRWVRKDRRVYTHSLCKLCGAAGGCGPEGCTTMTCLWCGTPQCSVNGLGHGACAVCLYGFLEGWSGSDAGQACSYKGCKEPAVGRFPRKGRACSSHGARIVNQRLKDGLAGSDYLERCLTVRERYWEAIEVQT